MSGVKEGDINAPSYRNQAQAKAGEDSRTTWHAYLLSHLPHLHLPLPSHQPIPALPLRACLPRLHLHDHVSMLILANSAWPGSS